MKKGIVIALALAALPTFHSLALAATKSEECANLLKAYDNQDMNLSEKMAEGIGDNSVARASLYATETNGYLAMMQIDIKLMEHLGCRLPDYPVNDSDYLSDAIRCRTDLLRASGGGNSVPPSCDRKHWKRRRGK